jgi:hypothetical protein
MIFQRHRLLVLCLLITAPLAAQQEEVRVVKPYTPTLSGADKIQLLPDLDEQVRYETPEFDYSIFPKRYETGFRLTPIKAARMVKSPLDKLYKSQLTLGAGNYLTPLAELRINQVRASQGTSGFLLKHHSMNRGLYLDREKQYRMDAGFNENDLEFYGKRFLRHSNFEYKVGASYDIFRHYGVDTARVDSASNLDLRHRFYTGYAGLGFQSARADSFHLNYKATLDYHFFSHELDQMEHGVILDGTVDQLIKDFRIGGDLGMEYYRHDASWDTLLTNHFIIKLNPYFTKTSNEWSFLAGVNTYTEIRNGKVTPRFYVRGKFSFNIVKNVLVPYLGVDGYQSSNSYRSVTNENPYVVPGLVVEPANTRILVYGGLKGRITNRVSYNLEGSYASVDNQYFFVTDSTGELHNQFGVIYDDLSVARVNGELTIRPSESLKLMLDANYYNYVLAREAHAWYKPNFDASIQGTYNLGDKILVDAGLYVIGPRYYPGVTASDPAGTLNTTVDLNLGVEYRYTNLLSFWAKFNNLTAQPYYQFYNYPSYRFRFMAGFSYSL